MKIKMLAVGSLGTNCYILEDTENKVAAVVDPGGDPKRIKKAIDEAGVTVQYILLTHGHYDHLDGLLGLVGLLDYPVAIYLNRQDVRGSLDRRLFPFAGKVTGYCCYNDGDTLTLGDITIHVLATPGHSPGSVTLMAGDVLFVGDTLFAGSCGRTDLDGGSQKELMKSLRRLGELEGDFHVCPGHMELTTLDQERRTNPYLIQAMRG